MARITLSYLCFDFENEHSVLNPIDVVTGNSNLPQKAKEKKFEMKNLFLSIPDGKTTVVLGPSGSGKSTLLKLVSGLVEPLSGEIRFDGQDVSGLAPRDRQIGMVFQEYALYPEMDVKSNILSYFLFRKRTPELEKEEKVRFRRTSDLMGVDINHLLDRVPRNLSGGEKQRVALARCITRNPALFLMDEPFSSLDQALRSKFRSSLKELLHEFNITTIYVTHDQHEATVLADQIAIMNQGQIEQVGSVEQLYHFPDNRFVAEFFNPNMEAISINWIDAEELTWAAQSNAIGVRPEDFSVYAEATEDGLAATIRTVTPVPLKHSVVYTAVLQKNILQVHHDTHTPFQEGDRIWLGLEKYHIFDKRTQQRIRTVPDTHA